MQCILRHIVLIIYVWDNFNTNAFIPDIDDIESEYSFALRGTYCRSEAFNTNAAI